MEQTMKEDALRFYSVGQAETYESACPNWPAVLSDFRKYLGKRWIDRNEIRYVVNGKPVYGIYRITGLEISDGDYYWIIRGSKGETRFVLANEAEFYDDIV